MNESSGQGLSFRDNSQYNIDENQFEDGNYDDQSDGEGGGGMGNEFEDMEFDSIPTFSSINDKYSTQ